MTTTNNPTPQQPKKPPVPKVKRSKHPLFLMLTAALLCVALFVLNSVVQAATPIPVTPQPIPTIAVTSITAQPIENADLGDAPDSTNNFGLPMTTYGGAVSAQFPTVFSGAAPRGPRHRNITYPYVLGIRISSEREADIGPDQDPTNNIIPPNNQANQDRFDDGLVQSFTPFVSCQARTVSMRVTNRTQVSQNVVLNGWYDFSRSGDFGQTFVCDDGTIADEWAVRNQQFSIAPGTTTLQLTVIAFDNGDPGSPMWARFTLSNSPAPTTAIDGRGPFNGYTFGETEDYLLTFISSEVTPIIIDN